MSVYRFLKIKIKTKVSSSISMSFKRIIKGEIFNIFLYRNFQSALVSEILTIFHYCIVFSLYIRVRGSVYQQTLSIACYFRYIIASLRPLASYMFV